MNTKEIGVIIKKRRQYLKVSRTDFEEFGRRIRLPKRVVKRELDAFAKENQMVKASIEHSFLSDILKRQYWLSVDYKRKMLVW